MFTTSSQKRFWIFEDAKEIQEIRMQHNAEFIEKHGAHMTPDQAKEYFLTPAEETLLIKQYQQFLTDFCRRFEPPMPKSVIGTAYHYFKRFYTKNSPMDYHPKEILMTCAYLACKVDEFNVSIGQFVANIKGDKHKAIDVILSNELLLMQKLDYYLTIHNPYRAVDGFFLDISTRTQFENPDRLRPAVDEFIEKAFYTDACFLYSPSQIALSAILHSASQASENYDGYVTDYLFQGARDQLPEFIGAIRKIRLLVKKLELPNMEMFRIIEKKLERCRNQEFNPESEIYKERARRRMLDDDDDGIVLEPEADCNPDSTVDMSVLNMSQ